MTKKQSFNYNQGISSRQIIIVLGITILAAAVIIVVFALLSNRQGNTGTQDYQNYLDQLKKQENTPGSSADQAEEEVQLQTINGVLTAIGEEDLEITVEGTSQKTKVSFLPGTTITYQDKIFERSRFYVGDQLAITGAEQNGAFVAQKIVVLVSASPATPAALPPITPQNIRPDGSIKPL